MCHDFFSSPVSLDSPVPLARYYASTAITKKRHVLLSMKLIFYINYLDQNFRLILLVLFLSAFSEIKVPESSVLGMIKKSALILVLNLCFSYIHSKIGIQLDLKFLNVQWSFIFLLFSGLFIKSSAQIGATPLSSNCDPQRYKK